MKILHYLRIYSKLHPWYNTYIGGDDMQMIGQKFGRLTVIEELPERKNGLIVYKCQCKCGKYTNVIGRELRRGHTKSCGCLIHDTITKHGKADTRLYSIYQNMLGRCYNKNNPRYKDWGGRGIKVCDEWLNDFQAFYDWAMNNGYKENLTIDRIDNNKGYTPSNCQWLTLYEQSQNRRNTLNVRYHNKVQSISKWINELNLSVTRPTIYNRLIKLGWNVEDAFYTPNIDYKCKEKSIENKLRKWLANKGVYAFGVLKQNKTVPDIGYHQKVFNGGYMCTPGIPDLSITIHSIDIRIECKQESGLLSAQQKHILKQILNSGGYGFILKPSNYDDVICFLQAIIDHDDETKKAMYQVLLGQTYELINARDRK